MVRRQHEQRSVFEMMLPDADKLWDDTLRRIDEVLEDEELVDGSKRRCDGGGPRAVREIAAVHPPPWCCGCWC
jgi:hypothetical protein